MVALSEASAAVSGIKAAYDLARGVQAVAADAKVKLATIDLMQAILSAQQSAVEALERETELHKRIAELEAKIASADVWTTESQRYVLTEFPLGSMAYVLKPEHANGEISHRLCPTCYQNGRKSILQVKARHSGGEIVHCMPCAKDIALSEFKSTPIPRERTGWVV